MNNPRGLTDAEKDEIAAFLFTKPTFRSGFDTLAELRARLNEYSNTVWDNYCTDCVGYSGFLCIIVWGASEITHTMLRRKMERKTFGGFTNTDRSLVLVGDWDDSGEYRDGEFTKATATS